MMKNLLSLKRPVFRLALVGAISVLLLGALAPEALGAASPTPTPKKSTTTPTPAPKKVDSHGQKEPTEKVQVGQAPSRANVSLNNRIQAAVRSFNTASLAVTNCDSSIGGTAPVCVYDLWARSGSVTPAAAPGLDSPMPIWGFTLDDEGQGQVPGPVLIMRQGQTLRIRLHNRLSSDAGNLSLEIPASSVTPDTTGIPRANNNSTSKTYNFSGLQPGTYLYQAGPTPDAPRQILMGLSGIIIVRPDGYVTTNTSAYGTSGQFQAETTLQVNEFDSQFNRDPFGFDPNEYTPDVFLVNGRAFRSNNGDGEGDNGGPIEVLAGSTLLIHYADLGNHDRGFTVLNHRQVTLTDDSSRNFANPVGTGQFLQQPANVATKWLTPGQVSDTFVTVDPANVEGARIPIYESGFHLSKADGSSGLGGMMTSLRVHSLNGTANGPVTTVAIGTTAGFTGQEALTFSGSLTSTGAVTGLEWFIDTLKAPGSGRLFSATECDGGFSVTNANRRFSCTIKAATLNALMLASPPVDGDHVVWVHGSNAVGGWGTVSGDVFTYNISGPDTGALSVHNTPTNGYRINDIANGAGAGGVYKASNDLVLLGTSTQSLADFTVLKGEYCLDSATLCANGSGTPLYLTPPMTTGPVGSPTMVLDPAGTACAPTVADYGVPGSPNTLPDAPGGGPVVAWCGFVPSSTLLGLSPGKHTLYAHAYEARNGTTTNGRWGSYGLAGASIDFVLDQSGPVVSGISMDPSPNNGKSSQGGNLNFLDSVQLTAVLTDPAPYASNIALGEVFVSAASVTDPTDPTVAAQFAAGTGAEMLPASAKWGDATSKTAYAYIPLAILTAYPDGVVKFWVHAQDVAGNWGGFAHYDMTLDRTPPILTAISPTTEGSNVGRCSDSTPCTIHFSATDPGTVATPIISGEWYLGQNIVRLPGDDVATSNDPGFGKGIPFSITPSATTVTDRTFSITTSLIAQYLVSINATAATLPPGSSINIVFRVRDAAGNWSNSQYVVGSA